jgi:hypothetical protein
MIKPKLKLFARIAEITIMVITNAQFKNCLTLMINQDNKIAHPLINVMMLIPSLMTQNVLIQVRSVVKLHSTQALSFQAVFNIITVEQLVNIVVKPLITRI